MSGAGAQLAPPPAHGVLPKGRSPLAHLLHALNQPLTGLQCSLELAVAGPRPAEQYVRTLHEGLELTGRMRILVEAIRELADTQPSDSDDAEPVLLDALLRATADDLLPIAETKRVHLRLESPAPLPLRADRPYLTTLLFRFLESALSLARTGSDLQILATPEPAHVHLVVSWKQGPLPEHSPFSRQELGLLIAQAGWERAGAEWTQTQAETTQTCTVRLPLAFPVSAR
jgi:hypothetical protein